MRFKYLVLLATAITISGFSSQLAAQQAEDLRRVFRQIGQQIAGGGLDGAEGTEAAAVAEDDVVAEDATELPQRKVEIKPNEIRLHLMDGSVVTGDLAVSELNITTDFGSLTVPVSRIRSLRPGLGSNPELRGELSTLVSELADDSYEVREQAQKRLIAFGTPIRKFVDAIEPGDDSELKRRLAAIEKALDEMADLDDEMEEGDSTWIEGDTVVTDSFTIVGKIENEQFSMASKYGQLSIKLADIQHGTRSWGTREPVSKSLKIDAQNFIQRTAASSKIRVERGDRISVKVDGTLYLSPWDETAGPDGLPDYGTYMGKFPIGGVVARVGKGEWLMVGSEESFAAPGNGTLEFAVVMMDNFVNQGYDWPGEFKLKIRVEPK